MSLSNSTPGAIPTPIAQSYLETLLAGERIACRQLIENSQAGGIEPYDLLTQLVWPTMELLQQLYREDRISISSLNLATRLNRIEALLIEMRGALDFHLKRIIALQRQVDILIERDRAK